MNLIEKYTKKCQPRATMTTTKLKYCKMQYTAATVEQQKVIDRVFIALCGWSLKTLIEGHEATELYNPYA